jgi:hypothetical protein
LPVVVLNLNIPCKESIQRLEQLARLALAETGEDTERIKTDNLGLALDSLTQQEQQEFFRAIAGLYLWTGFQYEKDYKCLFAHFISFAYMCSPAIHSTRTHVRW